MEAQQTQELPSADTGVDRNFLSPSAFRRFGLTEREGEVIGLVAYGRMNAEIGANLGISPRTVQRHLENVYDKLGVRTRTGVIGHLLRG
jgi:DNA-binding CsgD family transcriptional regulator